jgi:tRNA G18 (ribose-2'-O)-methylase SpoU
MAPGVDSLNVGSAAAVAFHAATPDETQGKSPGKT